MRHLVVCGLILATAASATLAAKGAKEDPAIRSIDAQIEKVDTSAKGWRTSLPKPEQVEFSADKTYVAHMKTSKGPVDIKLLPGHAPMHVTSFVYLARLGFFDGLSFHRVIPGFMAQGGCPLGTGTGSPGYKFGGEHDPDIKHDRPGLLSQANAGPGTDGSQFFLTFVETPWLDGKHTIFGETMGDDDLATLKELEKFGSRSGRTSEPLAIESVTIEVR